jgi:elongator complex protein 3
MFNKLLMKKPVRTLSGVAVLAVMTSPARCPHGRCAMCPGGIDSEFKSPQSYTGKEPAAMRGFQNDFDPYLQVRRRIQQLKEIGHKVDKIELIVMGGTFTARSEDYQRSFIKGCFDAMNDFPGGSLEEAKIMNESSGARCIGMTIETRPDYSREKNIDLLLELGATKVELGVQSIYNEILERIERGHSVEDTIAANKLLRDTGFKVGFHLMPGLPGSSLDDDVEMFREVFSQENFKPDYLKIYPTLVIRGTKLYDEWKAGKYTPLSTEEAAELLAEVKSFLPRWTRLQRIQRDIPSQEIEAGIKKGNLRQITRELLSRKNLRCKCIRCREVGLSGKSPENLSLRIEKYDSCGGVENFLSWEGDDVLVGFLRLRFPAQPYRKELKDASLIRELHIYGRMTPFGEHPDGSWQHRGYGASLLGKAEELSREEGYRKIVALSGIGAKGYYKKFGYRKEGPFMSKLL